jgi:Leucine-rich repeat (LRR) protein
MDRTSIVGSKANILTALDKYILVLTFSRNSEIYYLPINVADKFPNLMVYNASFCSIKKVLNMNFQFLSKLKTLDLSFNQVEVIEKETFVDLKSLETIRLSKQWLKLIAFCD